MAAPLFVLTAQADQDLLDDALKDGLLHVLRTPELLAMMWLAFLINLTAYPVSSGLLPYVAKHVYLVGATGLGWLAASFAFGSLLGSIATVVTGWPHQGGTVSAATAPAGPRCCGPWPSPGRSGDGCSGRSTPATEACS